MAWGRAYPSSTGTPWETPSPESMTIPVVRPEAYRERTAWMATYMAGMLKVSNMIWVIFSRLALGLRGASVRRTGCSSGTTGDDSVLNGVLEGKDTSLGLGLISNIGILLSHTDHHTLVAGTSNNGGEDSSGSVISSKSSLAHAGAIVNDKSSNVFVTHLGG